MRVKLVCATLMLTLMLLVACSGRDAAQCEVMTCAGTAGASAADASAAGAETGGMSGGASGGTPGFRPVPTLQPTESGPWIVDPADPMTLYALGNRSKRSTDGGHAWTDLAWPPGARDLLFAREPMPALFLRVAADGAESESLLKSVDGGVMWTSVGHVQDQRDDLVLVDQSSGPVLVASGDAGIFTSADEGRNWVASTLPAELDGSQRVGRILVFAGASPVVYVGATGINASVVLRSTDAGATFVAKTAPGGAAWSPPDISLDCQGRLYVLADQAIYRWSDMGSNWEIAASAPANLLNFEALQAPSSACSEVIYASGSDRTTGNAMSVRIDPSGDVTTKILPSSGTLSHLGDERLLLVTWFDLRQRSDDGGRSWWTAGISLALGDLALSPARPGLLFVTTVTGVYRSEDSGRSWQPRTIGRQPNVENGYPDAHEPNVVYARSILSGGAPYSFISRDGGASFEDWPIPAADNPEVPEAIAFAPNGSSEITVVTRRGIYTASDDRAEFTPRYLLPAAQQVSRAAISAADPAAIYLDVIESNTSLEPFQQLSTSLDGGATWATADPGGFVECLVAHPTQRQVAFACTLDGLLRTLDGGKNWSPVALPNADTPSSLRIDPRSPHALYALAHHLYRSGDQGNNWQLLPEPQPDVYDFEIDPFPGHTEYVLSSSGLLTELIE